MVLKGDIRPSSSVSKDEKDRITPISDIFHPIHVLQYRISGLSGYGFYIFSLQPSGVPMTCEEGIMPSSFRTRCNLCGPTSRMMVSHHPCALPSRVA